jgi:major membrane immunogen (membrane-anchored lipoprotein)
LLVINEIDAVSRLYHTALSFLVIFVKITNNLKTNIMKKLVYLFLTVLIVACSGSDDSNEQSNNAQFVGSWENVFEDEDPNNSDSLVLEFNADGTGSESETFNGETYSNGTFSWSSTNTTITVSYDDGDTFSAEYDFLTVDQVKFTINEDDETYEIIFDRVID